MQYNDGMASDTLSSADDLIVRIRWYVYLRWFILLIVIVPGLASLYIGEGYGAQLVRDALLGGVALATNVIFYLLARLLKNVRGIRVLAATIFSIDIALVTYFIYTKGGIDSRSVMIYVIPIIMSAAIFGRKGTYVFSVLSILMYNALIICNYFGIFASPNPEIAVRQTDFANVVNTVMFFTPLLILISLTIDFIAQILASKEKIATQHLMDLQRAQSIAKFGSWEWQKDADAITWSDELYIIFGVEQTDEPMTFERYMSFIHPDDRKALTATINRAVQKTQSFTVDHRIVLADGSVRYIHSDGQALTDDNGIVNRMIGTARDITDTMLLEKAKNDFVSVTSHQLRTPATIVKQYTSMLAEGYAGKLTAKQKRFLQMIYDSNERQITIINELLNIARIDSGNFTLNVQKTNLVTLLRDVTTDHAPKYKNKKQKLVFTPRYKTVYCDIDSGQFRMALENLLDNAHKYSPEKKTVKIDLKRHRSHATITVADQGVGIPAQDIDKVFNMFARVENPTVLQEEGTGIGLYWAKKIITLHSGNIEVASEPDKGTTFSIQLPYKNIATQSS